MNNEHGDTSDTARYIPQTLDQIDTRLVITQRNPRSLHQNNRMESFCSCSALALFLLSMFLSLFLSKEARYAGVPRGYLLIAMSSWIRGKHFSHTGMWWASRGIPDSCTFLIYSEYLQSYKKDDYTRDKVVGKEHTCLGWRYLNTLRLISRMIMHLEHFSWVVHGWSFCTKMRVISQNHQDEICHLGRVVDISSPKNGKMLGPLHS